MIWTISLRHLARTHQNQVRDSRSSPTLSWPWPMSAIGESVRSIRLLGNRNDFHPVPRFALVGEPIEIGTRWLQISAPGRKRTNTGPSLPTQFDRAPDAGLASLRGGARFLYDLRPFDHLGLNERGELLRRVRRSFDALLGQALLRIRASERPDEIGVYFLQQVP